MSRRRIILDTEGVGKIRLAHSVKIVWNFDLPSQESKPARVVWFGGVHRDNFGDGPACIGSNELLAPAHLLEELRQVFFGFVNVDDFHGRRRETHPV